MKKPFLFMFVMAGILNFSEPIFGWGTFGSKENIQIISNNQSNDTPTNLTVFQIALPAEIWCMIIERMEIDANKLFCLRKNCDIDQNFLHRNFLYALEQAKKDKAWIKNRAQSYLSSVVFYQPFKELKDVEFDFSIDYRQLKNAILSKIFMEQFYKKCVHKNYLSACYLYSKPKDLFKFVKPETIDFILKKSELSNFSKYGKVDKYREIKIDLFSNNNEIRVINVPGMLTDLCAAGFLNRLIELYPTVQKIIMKNFDFEKLDSFYEHFLNNYKSHDVILQEEERGFTLLHNFFRSIQGDVTIRNKLLKKYTSTRDVYVKNNAGFTPLSWACLRLKLYNPETIKDLLKRNSDPNNEHMNISNTCLMICFDQKNDFHSKNVYHLLEVAKLLIEHGADIQRKNKNGQTAYDLMLDNPHFGIKEVIDEKTQENNKCIQELIKLLNPTRILE